MIFASIVSTKRCILSNLFATALNFNKLFVSKLIDAVTNQTMGRKER